MAAVGAVTDKPRALCVLPSRGTCQYALNDTLPYIFCGKPGYPYCAKHYAICHLPSQTTCAECRRRVRGPATDGREDKMKLRHILAAAFAVALLALAPLALKAAGTYTNGLTGITLPWAGTELVPVDTNYPAGRAPQTVSSSVVKLQAFVPNALTDAATITPSGLYNLFRVTLGGNRTIANFSPEVPANGQFKIIVRQDATGSRTVTWGSKYKWFGDAAPTLTTTGTEADVITCFYEAAASGYYMCGAQLDVD